MDYVKKTQIPKQNRIAYVFDLQASQLTNLKTAEKLYNRFFTHYDTTNTSFSVIKDTAIEWVRVLLFALTKCNEPGCTVFQKFYLWAQHNFDNLDLIMDLRLLSTLSDSGNFDELIAIETFLVFKYGPYA